MARLGTGQSLNVTITGIPANATAVTVNVTIPADATAPGYLTVFPTGATRPLISTVNAEPGLVMSGAGTFQLGTGGMLTVFNAAGFVDVVMDVTGYFVASTPVLATNAASYAPGATVTYTGTNWNGCTAVKVDLFPGATIATGITPVGGSFTGTLTAPATAGEYILIAQSIPPVAGCDAFTTFTVT
jgi:hypothetical protein